MIAEWTREAADELGLSLEGSGRRFQLSGEVDGVPVWAKVFLGIDQQAITASAVVTFEPPLGLGLRLDPKGAFDWLVRDALRKDPAPPPIISREFDDEFHARFLHLDQARALITEPVAKVLMHANQQDLNPTVDDTTVEVATSMIGSAEQIVAVVEGAAKIARVLVDARKSVPAPGPVRMTARAFGPVVREIGGRVDPDTLEYSVKLEVGRLGVWVEHHEEQWWTLFDLSLDRDLLCELRMTDKREHPKWKLWIRPDIETGNAVFDETFVVRGEPEEQVRRVLDGPAQEALVELRRHAHSLLITNAHLQAGLAEAVRGSKTLLGVIHPLLAAGHALTSHLRRGHGPYR